MAKRIARLAVLTALAMILSYVERLIPLPVPVPGIKLGLANLVTLICLYLFGFRDALAVSAARVALSALLFGSLFSLLYALSGALLSLCLMALLRRTGRFSPVSISAVGGVAHNMAQLGVAALVTQTPALWGYASFLMPAGMITGVLVGIGGALMIRRLSAL